jgi:hypothetical protein
VVRSFGVELPGTRRLASTSIVRGTSGWPTAARGFRVTLHAEMPAARYYCPEGDEVKQPNGRHRGPHGCDDPARIPISPSISSAQWMGSGMKSGNHVEDAVHRGIVPKQQDEGHQSDAWNENNEHSGMASRRRWYWGRFAPTPSSRRRRLPEEELWTGYPEANAPYAASGHCQHAGSDQLGRCSFPRDWSAMHGRSSGPLEHVH